jgi:hypothetical protein
MMAQRDGSIPETHKIYYTTTDGNVVEVLKSSFKGGNLVSNTYENGQGILLFDNVVTEIQRGAFESSNLQTLTIPDGVEAIGPGIVLYPYNLSAVYGKFATPDNRCLVVDGVLKVFAQSGLTSYNIPDDVTALEDYAFNDTVFLHKVVVPSSVASIGLACFYYMGRMLSDGVIVQVQRYRAPSLGEYAFSPDFGGGLQIQVQSDRVDYYKSDKYWSAYANYITGY